MKNLYLIGGGGHCRSCIDVIEQEGKFKIKGIFDIEENVGKLVLGYEIIARDIDLQKFVSSDNYFLITIGHIKSSGARVKFYEKLKGLNANLAIIISPRAYVSRFAKIEEGTIVMHDALVNTNVEIGPNCIINTKALVEHDAKISQHCHISTATVVNGGCEIGEQCFIGSNSVLKEYITIAEKTLIPAGVFYNGK